MKSLGMTAAKVNPITAKLARAAEKISAHTKQINELQKTLDRLCGAKSTTEKKRVLTNTRQLMLVALVRPSRDRREHPARPTQGHRCL